MALRSDPWKRVHQNRPGIEQFPRQLGYLSSCDVCKDCCKVMSLTRRRINRWRTITHISTSRPHILAVVLGKGRFITGLADCPHVSGEKGHGKCIFSRHSTEWRSLKTSAFHLTVSGRKGRISNIIYFYHCTCSLKMLSWFPFFQRFFFGGREKMIWMWYARTRIFWQRRKNLPF